MLRLVGQAVEIAAFPAGEAGGWTRDGAWWADRSAAQWWPCSCLFSGAQKAQIPPAAAAYGTDYGSKPSRVQCRCSSWPLPTGCPWPGTLAA